MMSSMSASPEYEQAPLTAGGAGPLDGAYEQIDFRAAAGGNSSGGGGGAMYGVNGQAYETRPPQGTTAQQQQQQLYAVGATDADGVGEPAPRPRWC